MSPVRVSEEVDSLCVDVFSLAPPSRLTGSSSSLTSSSKEHSRKEYCAYSISCNLAGMHCSESHALRFLHFLLCVFVLLCLAFLTRSLAASIIIISNPVGIQHLYLILCTERLTSVFAVFIRHRRASEHNLTQLKAIIFSFVLFQLILFDFVLVSLAMMSFN